MHETGSPKDSGSAERHKFLQRFINCVSLFTTSSLHFSICCWNILEIDCMRTIIKGTGLPKDSGSVRLHKILRCFNTYQQGVWIPTRVLYRIPRLYAGWWFSLSHFMITVRWSNYDPTMTPSLEWYDIIFKIAGSLSLNNLVSLLVWLSISLTSASHLLL